MKKLTSTVAGFLLLMACQTQIPAEDLSQEEFDDLQEIVVSETEGSITSLGISETVLVVENVGISIQALPVGCRTIVAGSETDLDADNIPDDVTYEYNPAICIRSLPNNRTRSIGGRVRLEDTGVSPSIGYRFTFTDFEKIERRFGVVQFSETRNGIRSANLSADKLVLTRGNDLTVELKRPSRLRQLLHNQMNIVFNANSEIMPNQPFPAGTIGINGSVEWTRGSFPSRGYSTATQTPLQTDPTCESQRIVGGVQVLTRANLTIRFEYQPCGTAPIVTKILN
jgi:hypothetical protein